jgi:hypothetical protein
MTQYEIQVLQADIRMLPVVDGEPIEFFSGSGPDSKPYAALRTNSLTELNGWREVLQAGGRPHRLVNHAYGYRQEVNDPDW